MTLLNICTKHKYFILSVLLLFLLAILIYTNCKYYNGFTVGGDERDCINAFQRYCGSKQGVNGCQECVEDNSENLKACNKGNLHQLCSETPKCPIPPPSVQCNPKAHPVQMCPGNKHCPQCGKAACNCFHVPIDPAGRLPRCHNLECSDGKICCGGSCKCPDGFLEHRKGSAINTWCYKPY